MKNTNNRWSVSHPTYQGKKMTTKGKVTLLMVRDDASPTGWKTVPYSPDNKICEFVEWNEKDIANANLISVAPEMLQELKAIELGLNHTDSDWAKERLGYVRKIIARAEGK